ncbi:uncharacterized protein PHA67_023154 [Liasis olivaceus]
MRTGPERARLEAGQECPECKEAVPRASLGWVKASRFQSKLVKTSQLNPNAVIQKDISRARLDRAAGPSSPAARSPSGQPAALVPPRSAARAALPARPQSHSSRHAGLQHQAPAAEARPAGLPIQTGAAELSKRDPAAPGKPKGEKRQRESCGAARDGRLSARFPPVRSNGPAPPSQLFGSRSVTRASFAPRLSEGPPGGVGRGAASAPRYHGPPPKWKRRGRAEAAGRTRPALARRSPGRPGPGLGWAGLGRSKAAARPDSGGTRQRGRVGASTRKSRGRAARPRACAERPPPDAPDPLPPRGCRAIRPRARYARPDPPAAAAVPPFPRPS